MEKNKYEQALSQYNLSINDETVAATVKRIIEEKVPQNDTVAVKKFLMGSVELTTLKTTDSEESVLAFTEKVNKFEDTYPDRPATCRDHLRIPLFRPDCLSEPRSRRR